MAERIDRVLLRVVESMARNCTTRDGRARLQAKAEELRNKIKNDRATGA